jgi:uncharacterized protein (DUF927 family)
MSAEKIREFKPIKEFTEEQFQETMLPYEYLYNLKDNVFELERAIGRLSQQAKKYKINNFKTLYKSYSKQQDKKNKIKNYDSNYTEFSNQSQELQCGQWDAHDLGISYVNDYGVTETACVHPITISERLYNIDSGVEKLKISFKRGNRWRDSIIQKSILASSNKIIELADKGVAVTSESSKALVKFLHDLENENYTEIPEKKCCSRLGWIEEVGFAPYVDSLLFDGDYALSKIFNNVKEKGSFEDWKNEVKKVCKYNYINKIIIGASFAAPLVKILGINIYFLHLWADTEVAKSVACMVAASVWGNPHIGEYIQTFNSTNVGMERIAETCNSIPVFFDELQIKDNKDNLEKEVYELCEGAGRLRGNKNGGIDRTPTWNTCFITNGERPITSDSSNGGAVNRILEVECLEKLIENGRETSLCVKNNYGFAGKKFIENLDEEEILSMYKRYLKQIESKNKTEKQNSIGASILTALNYASEIIFDGELKLDVEEIITFLNDKSTVSANQKAYNYMMDWISVNIKKFKNNDNSEVYGKIETGEINIIKTIFDKMCFDAGFNSTSFLSWLKNNDKIECEPNRNTKRTRINGTQARCVCLKISYDDDYNEKTPF